MAHSAEELLAAVARTTAAAAASRAKADEDSLLRRAAVQSAMDAGIPRSDIAKAAGVHRNVLYKISGRTSSQNQPAVPAPMPSPGIDLQEETGQQAQGEAKKLLADIEATASAIRAADDARNQAEAQRRAAILIAVDAGIQRAAIARAADLTRARLYQIIHDTR
jgi:DNA-binding phage protein